MQGISIAVLAWWVAVNLATQTIRQAAKAFQFKGISSSTMIQDMESLQKVHGIVVFDVQAVYASSWHLATNLACFVTLSGSKGQFPAANMRVIAAAAQFPRRLR